MKKILIVEDVEFNLDLLVQLLEEKYELVLARDGAQGIAMAKEEKPDLILMDIALPVLNGWEATRRIKADESIAHIPVVGLSSYAMQGDAERAYQCGCDDYLTKPFNEDVLFEKIKRLIGG
jgi:CheY-like chemotaxis protein